MKVTKANWDLLFEMIKTDFKMRYHGSILGFLWVLLRPFFMFLILYFIFYYLFAKGDSFYVLRLILGLIVFNYFAEGISHGLGALMGKAGIILKVNFPRQIVVVASVVNSLITLFFSFIIYFVFWLFKPTEVTIYWLLFPLYMVVLTILIVGVSFFTSIISIRFRDLPVIWDLMVQLLFYASAIFYPVSVLPPHLRTLIFLSPATVFVQHAQSLLIDNVLPDMKFFAAVTVVSIGIFVAGYFFFKARIKRIAEYF